MAAMTLVLNSNFMAVDVAGWERAISLLFTGAAVVVDENLQCFDFKDWTELSAIMGDHANGFVHSPHMRIAIPEVIRLTQYDKMPKNTVVFTRKNIFLRDGNKCGYCGEKYKSSELTFDHIIPKSKGGKTNWENITSCCIPCNKLKANKTPKEAGMRLLVKPVKPRHQSAIKRLVVALPLKTRGAWQKLLDRSYWNSELEE